MTAREVGRFGDHVAKYMDDEVLVDLERRWLTRI
jgi:hypothetical protein